MIIIRLIFLFTIGFSQLSLASEVRELSFVYEDYPPYEYTDSNGQPTGSSTLKVKEICTKLNIRAKFVSAPWSRALQLVKSGQVDGIFSLNRNKERMRYLDYPDTPIAQAQEKVFTLKARGLKILAFSDLRHHMVGVVRDYAYGEKFDSMKNLRKVYAPTNANLIKRLKRGWLDLIVIDRHVFYHIIDSKGISRDLFTEHPLEISKEFLYLAFSKKRNLMELVPKFEKELKE